MKKLLILLTVLFAACSQQKPLTLMNVVEAFEPLPVKNAVIYDERTDPNHLLGRPGGYIEKMNFTDERITEKRDFCTIEVFANNADALKRKVYTEQIGDSAPMFSSYYFLHRNVLVRIDKQLPPSDAEAYKIALESLK